MTFVSIASCMMLCTLARPATSWQCELLFGRPGVVQSKQACITGQVFSPV